MPTAPVLVNWTSADANRPEIQPPKRDAAEFRAELARQAEAQRTLPSAAERTAPAHGVVRPQKTPLSGVQAAQALTEAWATRFGERPSAETVSVLTAQWAHETGRGASMLNFNFGGIKGTSPSGLSASYKTREGWGPTERRIVDRFRAYESAAEGAADYVGLLARKYPEAVQAAKGGDPAGFVRALKRGGYFTGDERAYVRSVVGMSRQALAHGYDAIGGAGGASRATYAPLAPAPVLSPDWSVASAGRSASSPDRTLASAEAPRDYRGLSAALPWPHEGVLDEIARVTLQAARPRREDDDGRRG